LAMTPHSIMHSYIRSPIASEHEFIHLIGDAKIACSLRQRVREGQRHQPPNRGMIGRVDSTKAKKFLKLHTVRYFSYFSPQFVIYYSTKSFLSIAL
jgi:hypothetical protein